MNRVLLLVFGIAVAVLLVLVNFTTPAGIGPLGVLVFFTTFYALCFCVAVWLVRSFFNAIGQKNRQTKKELAYATVIAFSPIMLLLVQSFGRVNLLTGFLIGFFVFLGCLLVNKRL